MLQSPQATPQAAAPQAAPANGAQPQADGYDAGMAIVHKSLYGAEAARDMAKALKTAQDPAEGMANAAYEMVTIADEATKGSIPDERLIEFATEVLGEVADIAQAAGVEVKGSVIAKATQLMLVRYVTEQGLDPSQLQAAMAKVDTEKLGAQLDKVGA
jgi:hypothetical protein